MSRTIPPAQVVAVLGDYLGTGYFPRAGLAAPPATDALRKHSTRRGRAATIADPSRREARASLEPATALGSGP